MTLPAWAIAVVLTPLLGTLAYFIRLSTFDAITQLRKSAEKQGARLGRLEKAMAVVLRELEAKDAAAPAPRLRRHTLLELQAELERDDEDTSK